MVPRVVLRKLRVRRRLVVMLAVVGVMVLPASALAAAPPNDNLASALPLSGATTSVTGSNVDATREAGEPSSIQVPTASSVWYSWTAPFTGTVSIDMCGSDFWTVIGFFEGTSYPLQLVDGGQGGNSSQGGGCIPLKIGVHSGDAYSIEVAGDDSRGAPRSTKLFKSAGNLQLNLALAADTTPPDTSLLSWTAGTVRATSARFTFMSSESPATYECALDGGAFSACASPQTYSSLGDGPHSFAVRSIDTSQNTDPSPDTMTWTVDATAPQTSIDSGPSGSTSATDASFEFTADESSTFECAVDGAAFAACSSPQSYTGLSEGAHTFSVRATDAAGNTEAAPPTRTWTVGTTAPQTPIDSGPSGSTGPAASPPPAGTIPPAGTAPAPTPHALVLGVVVTAPKLKAFLAKGLKAALRASAPTTVKCTLTLAAKTGAKPVSVGTCRATLNGTTAKTVTIKPSSKARTALRKRNRAKLKLVVTAGDTTATRTVTIKR